MSVLIPLLFSFGIPAIIAASLALGMMIGSTHRS
jgi:hypothetical protein